MRRLLALCVLAAFGAVVVAAPRDDTKPADANALAALIDKQIADRLVKEKITASPVADDAEFLRRAYLDLTGRIPSAGKTIAFLDSTDAKKRDKLIDELLASKEYGRHFASIWRDLMVRPDANMIRPPDTQPFVEWMAEQLNKGRGWDAVVTDMLVAEGAKPEGTFTILNGNSRGYPQANVIAGSVGQLFMGVQLACAECHHHPFVADWKQEDFWGMAAFFGNVKSTAANNKAKGLIGITEGPGKQDKKRNEAPTMKGTAIVIPDSSFKQIGKTVEARFPHAKDKPALESKKPFRPAFAAWLVSKDNPYFARNAVNRTWAHLLGRGFANPVGETSSVNPPSHPELLDELAKQLGQHDFDLKFLIKGIALSQAYQRTSRPNASNKGEDHYFARQEVKVLTPGVLHDSLTQALEVNSLFTAGKGGAAKKKGKAAPNPNTVEQQKKKFIEFFTTKEVDAESTEFSHGIPQALRLMNQELFNTGGNTLDRVVKAGGGHDKVISGLYVAVLSRRPTAAETKEMTAYVEKQKDHKDGYRGVFWALVNGAEFMLNR